MAVPALDSPRAWVQINASNNPNKPIIIEINGEMAPVTGANFIKLAQEHYYDDTVFHRVIPGFVCQGGDPSQTHSKPPSYDRFDSIPLEITTTTSRIPVYHRVLDQTQSPVLHHEYGAIAMARTDDPDSASTQFYFVTGPPENVRHLDGGYAVFGKVVDGMDVVASLQQGDYIVAVHVLEEEKIQMGSREV